ncbi:alpha/beta fold hydrolase [Trinickia sp. LjRoot230]|uniref:alpha/beta fold hydrolase n=1 Tax=Trinickia sp. LjRoot230 TaxID=3342288 RepID=UPI003ECE60B5
MTSHSSDLVRAFKVIEQLEDKLDAISEAHAQPIAIVGMACRFPGAENLDAYWDLLCEGREAVSDVPPERWDIDALYHADPDAPGKMSTRRGGFIDGVDLFDAAFFNISPREAALMDPQQRLLLELSWSALEHAAIAPTSLEGSDAGVFAGVTCSDYMRMAAQNPANLNAYWGTGSVSSVIAGRIAYTLGLHGPCVSIDTACSSALVAIHHAVRSLRTGECGIALAVSANLVLAPEATIAFSKARMMSPDGRCQTFDERANGYVRSEGAAALVLKTLQRARADGDRIHAIIRGSAINQDGASSGLTVPNGLAQAALIRRALEDGRVKPEEVGYIEAHGTGTPLGDPIEVQALGDVFRASHSPRDPVYLGSVKSLIGHLELAAGMAGVIKLVLSLEHDTIPGYPRLGQLNSRVAWEQLPLSVVREPVAWPVARRIGGVSSFGFSGTNAHVVIEGAPYMAHADGATSTESAQQPLHLLCLSARSETALTALAHRYADYLTKEPTLDIDAVCYTAANGRAHLPHRLAVTASNAAEFAAHLRHIEAVAPPALARNIAPAVEPFVVFAFSGQGAQYSGMAHSLYEFHPVFRDAIDQCAAALVNELDVPLCDVLWGGATHRLSETRYTQPSLFAVEYALARLWQSWGVKPAFVVGHSIGEFAAACIADVFSVEDGARLVAARGRLMQALPAGGAMAALAAPREAVAAAIIGFEGELSIAACNAPMQTVLSGKREALLTACQRLRDTLGIDEPRLLDVSHAFHSPLMRPMLEAFREVANSVSYAPANCGFVSTVTGALATDIVSTPNYWVDHVLAPVDFARAMATLAEHRAAIVLEIGPGTTLAALARACTIEQPVHAIASLRRGSGDWQTLLAALGQLFVAGVHADWRRAGRLEQPAPQRLVLPGYPFERVRHWLPETPATHAGSELALTVASARAAHPLLGNPVRAAVIGPDEALFQSLLSTRERAFLRDHRVYGKIVVPAAAYLDMALAAAAAQYPDRETTLIDVSIQAALVLAQERPTLVQTVLTRSVDTRRFAWRIVSLPGESIDDGDTDASASAEWRVHVSGELDPALSTAHSQTHRAQAQIDLTALSSRFARAGTSIDVDAFYERYAALGLDYGPAFRSVRSVSRIAAERASLACVAVAAADLNRHVIHPALLDGCFQAVGAIFPDLGADIAYLPVAVERLSVHGTVGSELWSHAVARERTPGDTRVTADLRLYDGGGRLIASIEGLQAVPVDRRALTFATAAWKRMLYSRNWMPQPRPASMKRADIGGGWLLLADRTPRARQLADALTRRDQIVVLIDREESERMTRGDITHTIEARFTQHKIPLAGVVLLSSTESEAGRDIQDNEVTDAFERAQAQTCMRALALTQALGTLQHEATAPRLWFVTAGAQTVDGEGPADAVQAMLWGLARTAALEYPSLRCTCIDLPPHESALPSDLVDELLAPAAEPQIAYRRARRYVARLAALKSLPRAHLLTRPKDAFRLRATEYGAFDRLALIPFERITPSDQEVEIEVCASALNFKDVLFSLGMLREFSERHGIIAALDQPLGFECAGKIVRIGAGVRHLRVGDDVVAMAPSAMSSHVVIDSRLVHRKPAAISFEAAAALPTVFMTAIHSLERLAHIQPGERVLIHACAGGVGQAALQIAQRAGAIVYGTASPAKWDVLKRQGVAHVMHSRNVEFAGEIMRVTQGHGVDIVVNSLSGPFIEKSADVLAPGGRFIEIGKIGIWSAEQMAAYRPDIVYRSFDLGELDDTAGGLQADLLGEVMRRIDAGELHPLPSKAFPIERADAAFRYLAQANQIGKVVLTVSSPNEISAPSTDTVRSDRSYLVTGGLGTLGREVAKWLAARGARQIVLASRHPVESAVESLATELGDAQLFAWPVDVADAASVASLIDRMKRELLPLAGIVHAAGLLEDGTLANQGWPQFERVLTAKAAGAWHLHRATQHLRLDLFVMFSSIASVFGAPGQANYAAANASLDALAHYRRAQGLPATSINWGPWDAGGMAERTRVANEARFAAVGLRRLSVTDGVEILEYAALSDLAQVVVADVAWERFMRTAVQPESAAFYALVGQPPAPGQASSGNVIAKLHQAEPDARAALLTEALRGFIASVVGLPSPQMIDSATPLRTLGIDSLMAVELKHKLEQALHCTLEAAVLVEHPTLDALCAYLLDVALAGAQPQPAARSAAPAYADESLGVLSDEVIDIAHRRIGICRWQASESAPLAVCVHGILDQAAIWNNVAVELVSHGIGVLAPDLRGHGRSSHAPAGASLTALDFVTDLADVLEREALTEPFILIGHSTGAAVCALYAALHPERVAHLVMIEPIAPTLRSTLDPLERIATDLRYLRTAPEHPVYPDLPSAARMLSINHPKLDEASALALARRIAVDVPGGVSWAWDARLRNQFGVDLSLAFDEYLAVLRSLRMPSTRIYGKSSAFADTPALLAPLVALPASSHVFIEGGHNLHTDAATALAGHIAACFDARFDKLTQE